MSVSARTNRDDLFVSSARGRVSGPPAEPGSRTNRAESKDEHKGSSSADEEDRNPLQLEHMIGFNASFPMSVQMISRSENLFVRRQVLTFFLNLRYC
jgi:hypothetical protein